MNKTAFAQTAQTVGKKVDWNDYRANFLLLFFETKFARFTVKTFTTKPDSVCGCDSH